MKRYLWAAVLAVFVAANASGNPFDLNVNLKKIDQDKNDLLSQLKDITAAKEERRKESKEEDIKQGADTPISAREEGEIEADDAVVVQPSTKEEERIKKIKEEQLKIEAQRVQKEKEEKERIAAEKREAQRVAKEKLEAEKTAQLEAEKAKLESEKLSKEKHAATKGAIADVNTVREEIEAAKKADKAYREAVIEVDRED